MKTRLVLRPGQRGTVQLSKIYGERLLFVRYRYDEDRHMRVKTVEIVVDEAPWSPPQEHEPDELVYIVVGPREHALQKRIYDAGGRWVARRGAWRISYAEAAQLGLTGRIVEDSAEQ